MGETRFATVNGVRAAYETSGDGFPLLLLHGFPRTRRTWEKAAPALAERFAVVAPDRRGYGESDAPADPAAYALGDMAADAVALMDHLGHERFIVVGHDKGAPTARRVAADLPERVAGMVQIDAAPQGVGKERRDPGGRQWYFDFFRQRNVAEPIVNAIPELFFGLFLDRNPHLTPEERAFYVASYSRPGVADAVIQDYRLALEEDPAYWRAELEAGRRVRVPTLCVWGASGPSAGLDVLGLWRQAADDVRGLPIKGSAHYVQEQRPDAVAAAIIAFANELGV